MVQPFAERFNNKRRCPEVHIGYPHRDHVGFAEDLLTLVPLETVGVYPVWRLFKVVFHETINATGCKVNRK